MRLPLILIAASLAAAGPTGASGNSGINMVPALPGFTANNLSTQPQPAPNAFTPAPTPNQDARLPTARASNEASLGAGFFQRGQQYRGEAFGFNNSDSASIQENRRVQPGAGFKLSVPMQ